MRLGGIRLHSISSDGTLIPGWTWTGLQPPWNVSAPFRLVVQSGLPALFHGTKPISVFCRYDGWDEISVGFDEGGFRSPRIPKFQSRVKLDAIISFVDRKPFRGAKRQLA